MKRLLTFMAVICGLVFVTAAQRPLVTLSHNGELSFFSNLSALGSALDSAKNGDIIYLSEGDFTSNSGNITIAKRVSIKGCGYKSHIIPAVGVKMDNNPDSYFDAPLFDGVRLGTLEFVALGSSRNNLRDVVIKNSYIGDLTCGGFAGNNFLLEKCFIEKADFFGATGNNTYLSNCKIKELKDSNGMEICDICVQNCNIYFTLYCPRFVSNSIIAKTKYNSMYVNGNHRIINSLFPSLELTRNDQIITSNCYYDPDTTLDDNLDCTIDLAAKGYFGEDKTVVGVYGGEFPFSENPSVPTVDSENSSVEYDADANKLKVTITVKSN